MSSEKFYSEKLKRAAHLLFFKRGKLPGAKLWELKAGLGVNYEEVLKQLNDMLADLDLEVFKVEGGEAMAEHPEEARYFVRLRGSLKPKEARLSGWRIDSLAALAMAIAYIVSKQGKAPRDELERMIGEKLGRWRSMALMDTFLRVGYLAEDQSGSVVLGWRTNAEVDLKKLMEQLAEA